MEPWHELVIDGSEDAVRGFVVGVLAGRGSTAPAYFGRDLGLEHESLVERLRALFAEGTHHVVFASGSLATALAQALAARGVDAGLRLEHSRVVRGARFHFTVTTYSHDVALTLRRTFRDAVPPGVRVEGFTEQEVTDPDAIGVEIYRPIHHYTYTCSGETIGDVGGVLDLRHRASEIDVVECGPLRLDA